MLSSPSRARHQGSITPSWKNYIFAVGVLALVGCEEALVKPQEFSTETLPALMLDVSDQIPEDDDGMTRNKVKLGSVSINENGWAVLYEGACFDEDGEVQVTTILGQAELVDSTYDTAEEGAQPNLNEETEINTSRPLLPNETLCAMIHGDSGTQRDFEYEATSPFTYAGATNLDKPLLLNDKPVGVTFAALILPELDVQDQDVTAQTAGEITIASVSTNGPGWVSVVKGDCADAESEVLGHVFVSNGEATEVSLPLNAPITETVTLCARLHHDAPADGVFSFERIPGNEPPVTITTGEGDDAEQTPVMTTFEVTFQ